MRVPEGALGCCWVILMKLNKYIFKDYQLRKNYYKLESFLLILKALTLFKKFEIVDRDHFFHLFNSFTLKFTRIRNRCLYTGRARGILSEFKMSRIQFRRLADNGKIPGIRRASW